MKNLLTYILLIASIIAQGQIKSVKSGPWNDAATWGGKTVGSTSGTIEISAGHTVSLSETVILNNRNVLVYGTWLLRPGAFVQITGINENAFVGGGDVFLESDKGFWFFNNGNIDAQGTPLTGWTNAESGVTKGTATVRLKDIGGWKVGHEIAIVPTAGLGVRPSQEYEERTIVAINGRDVTVNQPFQFDHPTYTTLGGKLMTPEVMNLTRDIRLEGTPTGRTHFFIKSTGAKQIMNYVQFRHMGPRKDQTQTDQDGRVYPLDGIPDLVLGRYSAHWHHTHEANRGQTYQGLVSRDAGNHAIVPHGTNNVKFLDCIAYNVTETAYWSDFQHRGNGVIHEKCIAAKLNHVQGALMIDKAALDDVTRSSGVIGFMIGVGDDNQWIDCVTVGAYGDPQFHGAFKWEANNDGVASKFLRCIAHNNVTGNIIWQISPKNHIIDGFISYNNNVDQFQGAYINGYTNLRGDHNGLTILKANAIEKGQPCYDMVFKDLNFEAAQVMGQRPVQIINSTIFGNVTSTGLFTDGDANGNDVETVKKVDLINVDVRGTVTLDRGTARAEVIRVQPKIGQSYQITHSGRTNIAEFAPRVWGKGDGLKGEYFKPDGTKALERLDIQLYYDDWYVIENSPNVLDVDYRLGQVKSFKVKWTGKIEGYHSEEYTFRFYASGSVDAAGVLDFKINGVNIPLTRAVVSGDDKDYLQGRARLTAGVPVPIEINFNSHGGQGAGFIMWWKSPSLAKMIAEEVVPMSQLYSGGTIVTPPPPPAIFNVAKSRTFTKNDCPAGTTPIGTYTYTVPASKYSAPTQAEADQMAEAEITANGQKAANANTTCISITPPTPTVFSNVAFTKQFTRNNCGSNATGSTHSIAVVAGQFKSTVSVADADLQANAWAQSEANRIGTCTPIVVEPNPEVPVYKVTFEGIIKIVSNVSRPYTITTSTGRTVLKSGTLQVGENRIDVSALTQDVLLVKVAGVTIQRITK